MCFQLYTFANRAVRRNQFGHDSHEVLQNPNYINHNWSVEYISAQAILLFSYFDWRSRAHCKNARDVTNRQLGLCSWSRANGQVYWPRKMMRCMRWSITADWRSNAPLSGSMIYANKYWSCDQEIGYHEHRVAHEQCIKRRRVAARTSRSSIHLPLASSIHIFRPRWILYI